MMIGNMKWSFRFLLLLSLLGCGSGRKPKLPETFPVKGTVTLNGQPVDGAQVMFQRLDSSRGAVGETNAEGEFTLTSYSLDGGARPGEYRVQIFQYEKFPPGTPDEKFQNPRQLLPVRYTKVETSGLVATVTEDGAKNVFRFDMKK